MYLVVILGIILGEYILELLVESLNLGHAKVGLPEEFKDTYSAEGYGRSQNYLKERTVRDETKHKTKMLVHNILLPIISCLYIYLYIKAVSNNEPLEVTFIAVLLPLLAYMGIHHPRGMFILGHLFTIDNIEDVELSDWYIISSKIGGCLCALCAFVFLIICTM